MKKKFLTVILCLMVCLSTFALSACMDKKETPPAEPTEAEIAMKTMEAAFENMMEQTTFKMLTNIEGDNFTIIISGENMYVETTSPAIPEFEMPETDLKIWTIKESTGFFDYTIATLKHETPMVVYSKAASEGGMMGMDDLYSPEEGVEFVSSTTEEGVTTLVFKNSEDSEVPYATYVIENDLIVSVIMENAEHETVGEVELVYEDVEFPELPTEDGDGPIVWDPSIEE